MTVITTIEHIGGHFSHCNKEKGNKMQTDGKEEN